MARLTGSKRVVAIAAAAFLVTAVSGTALAMLDPGLVSFGTQSAGRQAEQRSSTFQSPAATPERSTEVEIRGTVESMATSGWVIAGRAVIVTGQTELKGSIAIGSQVKVEGRTLPDGSVQAREIHLIAAGDDNDNGNGNANENENHNGNMNSNDNDDNHGNGNGNDDDGNGNVNSNDNGNDDHGNGNEDHNGNMNSNDNGDDHGGNGNGNHNDNNDNHGGSGNGNHNDNGDDHGGSDNHNGNGDDHGGNGNGDD